MEGGRRLAAIMFTDMVGYTALGQRDESLSLALHDEGPSGKRRVVPGFEKTFLVSHPSLEALGKAIHRHQ